MELELINILIPGHVLTVDIVRIVVVRDMDITLGIINLSGVKLGYPEQDMLLSMLQFSNFSQF